MWVIVTVNGMGRTFKSPADAIDTSIGMVISGGLAGMGGAVLVLFTNRYHEGQTGGRGF